MPKPIPLDTDSAEALRELVTALFHLHGHDLPAAVNIDLSIHLYDRRDLYDALVPTHAAQSLFPDHTVPFRTARIADNTDWPLGDTRITLYSIMTPEEVEDARRMQLNTEQENTPCHNQTKPS